MDEFAVCEKINNLILADNEKEARDELILLLDYLKNNGISYSPIVNHFIRSLGLYPYINPATSNWQERFVHQAFQVNTGDEKKTLHREQSYLLRLLLENQDIAVSAPTSFGKSFVIDAFISIKNPKNVMLIVPTLALVDETRRRMQKKFCKQYKIITTPEVSLASRNIFIFPQERAINYVNKIKTIDILIVDEFYKAGVDFDKERAPVLLKSILELKGKAKQRYFLAPNISELPDNVFTRGMTFVPLDFNTVYSKIYRCYDTPEFSLNLEEAKENRLLEILKEKQTKTLIYAGTYKNIDAVISILDENLQENGSEILNLFSSWLKIHYGRDYILSEVVKKGVGIHNGHLHRSLSQIQIKLFEERDRGINTIVSTSSIIEGVNTSAENVIIWSNRNGVARINDFTYKNIAGRSGRMFQHFVGKIYLFVKPPVAEPTLLGLKFPDELLASLDTEKVKPELTREQEIKIIAYQSEMDDLLGGDGKYKSLIHDSTVQTYKPDAIKKIIKDMKDNPRSWNGLAYLNSPDPRKWERFLYKAAKFSGNLDIQYRDFFSFVSVLTLNWNLSIPLMLSRLRSIGVTVEKFFQLERNVTFKLSATFANINAIYNVVFQSDVDISPFIVKVSHAFLPKLVYELEEYGLPRMVSKKVQLSGLIDLENKETPIHDILEKFNQIGVDQLKKAIPNIHSFEDYILDYFYEGISQNEVREKLKD